MVEYYGADKTDFDLKLLMFGFFSILFILVISLSASAETYSVIGSRDLVTSTDNNYAFMNQNQFFEVYYGSNPSSGNVVKIVKDGVEMTLLPMALNWNNDLSQLQQISMPQNVQGNRNGQTLENIKYQNAYGSGIDLIYETLGNQVKEKIIINDFSNLVAPAQYVIDGGNVKLEVGFQLSTNAQHIEIDGVDWDMGSEITTTNDVIIKNNLGETLYTLPRPFAVDDNGVVSYGSYQFKKSANKLYVRMYFDYSFLQTATYPVVLDPTFVVDYSPIPAEHLQGGTNHNLSDLDYINVEDISTGVSDTNDATTYITRGESLLSSQSSFYLTQDDAERDGQDKFENMDMGKQFDLPNPSLIDTIEVCYYARTRFAPPILNDVFIRIGNTQTTVPLPHTPKDLWQDTCVDITSQKGLLVTGNNIIGMTQPLDGNDWELGIDQDAPLVGSFDSVLPMGTWLPETNDYMIRLNYTTYDPLVTWADEYFGNGWIFDDQNSVDYTEEVSYYNDGLTTGNKLLQWGALKYIDLHINDGVMVDGDYIELWIKTFQVTDYGKVVRITDITDTILYGSFIMPSQTTTFEFRNVTLSNTGSGITDMVWHDSIITANIIAEIDYIHPYYDHTDVFGGIGISSHWNVTDNAISNYWLRVKKTSGDPADIYILPYLDEDDVNNQILATQSLVGTGWFNIPVDSLMDYQTNTLALGYTNLRFWTDVPNYFSEVYLRSETNDVTSPVIQDCTTDKTELTCFETAFLRCNITDNLDVQNANFTLNGQNYQAVMNNDYWELTFTPQEMDGSVIYDWTDVDAQDIVGLTSNYDPNLQINYTCDYDDYIGITHSGIDAVDQLNLTETSVIIYWTTTNPSDSLVEYGLSPSNLSESAYVSGNVTEHYVPLTGLDDNVTYYYSVTSSYNPTQTLTGFSFTTLLACQENWVADAWSCSTSDDYFATFQDTNACGTFADLPATNGTYQYCNYCSEDLLQIVGDCEQTGLQTVDWYDDNYFTCCDITELTSDCSITFYPYNETTTQSCLFFNNTMGDIECQNIPNINKNEKEYCLAHIPNQYLNEEFKCIAFVTDLETNEIMQTTPEYRERSTSLLDFKKDPETREYFAPANALVNFYYTDKNLLPEQEYILTVECSSIERTLSSSMTLEMRYEDYEFVFFRTKWLMENAGYVIAGLLMLFITLFVLLWIFKGAN